MAWISKLSLLACACIIIISAYVAYDLNGRSFDFSDRDVVLIVTDSMDGNVHEYAIDSFPANTLVMVQHTPENEKRFLKEGDVISYKGNDGVLMHHRVVQVNPDSVYVHGDNNRATEKVYFGEIEGKVVGTNPWLGSAMVLIQNNFFVFLAAMFILCSALVVFGMRSRDCREEAD